MKVTWEPNDIKAGLRVRQFLNNTRPMTEWIILNFCITENNDFILKYAFATFPECTIFEICSSEELAEKLTESGFQIIRD